MDGLIAVSKSGPPDAEIFKEDALDSVTDSVDLIPDLDTAQANG
jgi:hypothetical protein